MAESPPFKYQEELDKINNCPHSSCEESERTSFRFVNDDVEDEDNWISKAEKDRRENKFPRSPSLAKECSYHALSFFDTIDSAQKKLNSFNPSIKEKMNISGIATGKIVTDDGVCSPINKMGHFSLYEYEKVSFKGRFEKVE